MFGIESSELAVIALVALLVIGPKDLPRVMRLVGQWMAKGRAMTRHVRAGFDTMMREAELDEMQKQWAAQNEAIMKATALPDLGVRSAIDETRSVLSADDWMLPTPPLAPEVAPGASTTATEPAMAPPKPRRPRARKPTTSPEPVPPAKPARTRRPRATAPVPTDP